ncbi:tetratricopeptide repeat domain-containing protein [Coemansia sp. RSA 1813]|nr:tetratricopeptide repeat domain-containing protein [Coemansia sp. RSA 1843]KAJ2086491.1 tetratricopeptide repeat domain-containing protein [Coemansia sp. RSA 986]KAJ2213499.1 tetratricopeptide repeat domain-containing protein [Coemansia sp. RSA 487]KAJ2564839.1 tetratricopeptide repeat domain-containing protein [Coemansia sp. RSA 1813]
MSASLKLLSEIRQSSERRPFEVLKLSEPLLNKGAISQAGDEVWLVYEQVFLAAIDEGQIDVAKAVLAILHSRFGEESQRVKRLYGLVSEATGHPDEAKQLYDEMLEKDATNVLANKRLIALLKSQGQNVQAIQELVSYLDTHGNDFEAWLELMHLYMDQHLYSQAAFCVEEVILQQPANHYFHLCYAEISYTMGNLDIALKEYLRVVELSTDNVRGFYGVKLTADRILDISSRASGKSKGSSHQFKIDNAPQKATLERLSQLATERLLAIYSGSSNAMKKTLEAWLKL